MFALTCVEFSEDTLLPTKEWGEEDDVIFLSILGGAKEKEREM